MKKFFLLIVILLGVFSMIITGEETKKISKQETSKEDLAEIKKACLDYVEGWFESNAERMKISVHQNLVKRRIRDNNIVEMNREKLLENAVNAKRNKPEIIVEIFDVYNGIAIAKVTSTFVDYVQVAKIDGKWQILNVLWAN